MIATATRQNVASTFPTVAPGTGVLRVARWRDGSLVRTSCASSPLRLLTPRNHGQAAWIYTSTFGGGLLDGDSLHLTVDVEQGASAWLSTQASTKVYRSPAGESSSGIDARLDADSLLIVAPDPVVCFAGARYRQHQRFFLDASAGLVLVDWYTSGRHARGERWAFDAYSTRTEVWRDGRLAWCDALRLHAADGSIAARIGRFDVIATIAIAGPALQHHAARVVADIGGVPVNRHSPAIVTASPIDGGCVIRLAGTSVETAARAIRGYLAFVPRLLGDDPWARRW